MNDLSEPTYSFFTVSIAVIIALVPITITAIVLVVGALAVQSIAIPQQAFADSAKVHFMDANKDQRLLEILITRVFTEIKD